MKRKNNVKNQKVTYKKSGVSIENADKLIDKIKPIAKKTCDKNVIGSIGGFDIIDRMFVKTRLFEGCTCTTLLAFCTLWTLVLLLPGLTARVT